jgi:hypothetical protein
VNAYRKGRRLEDRSKAFLQAQGFEVMRSAGSHGAFDLACFSVFETVLIQVKAARPPSAAEMERLREFRCRPDVRREVHVWRDRAHAPEVLEVA